MAVEIGAGIRNLDEILWALMHRTLVFPESTNETVTLTCAGANVWGAWTEIVDNNAVTFSSRISAAICDFAQITAVVVETCSVNDQRFMFEVAYGTPLVSIAPFRVYSGAVPKQESVFKAGPIPAGNRVYYRGMCSQAGPQSCTIHIRYSYH